MSSKDLISEYAELVTGRAPAERAPRHHSGRLTSAEIPSFLEWVKRLEATPESHQLATQEDDDFDERGYPYGLWNFFRRSAFYLDAYLGFKPDRDQLLAEYERQSATREGLTTRYLAPLSSVWLPNDDFSMPGFAIRRF